MSVETQRTIPSVEPVPWRARGASFWSRSRRWPVASITVVSVLVVCAVFAEWIAPYDPIRGNLPDRNIPPLLFGGDADHILGTDPLGRDIFSRLVFGARIALMVVGVTLVTGGGFGVTLGLVSGYAGGWTDEAIMRITDIKFALPLILIALALVVVLGASLGLLLGLLAFLIWGRFARQVRGEVLSLKQRDFVKLAQVAGASSARILYKHILPGVSGTILVVATMQVGAVILTAASLSFLGAGVPPPTPAWGAMVAEGRLYLNTAWWVSLIPGVAIGLTVMAFTLLGDWLRDRLDPTLRQL